MRGRLILLIPLLVLLAGAAGFGWGALNARVPSLPVPTPEVRQRTSLGLHFSSFPNVDFFEQAYANISPDATAAAGNVRGVVVPHHLLAATSIAEVFQTVASDDPKTIVLISPNHFLAGHGQITSSIFDWQTPYGMLESNIDLIRTLEAQELITIDELPFEKEHGIFNLVGFIKKSFPNTALVPLIIKDTVSEKTLEHFSNSLRSLLPNNTLWVASLDFSHTLPKRVADFHDETSLAVLSTLEDNHNNPLDIDSQPALRIFLKEMKGQDAQHFQLVRHTNSADLIGNEALTDTTSHFAATYSTGEPQAEDRVTILAFGDLMLDRYVRQRIDREGKEYPFQPIKRLLMGNDLVLANLEGCFTNFPPKTLHPNNTTFTVDPKMASVLNSFGFNLLSLANNHAFDFGNQGFSQCQEILKENKLASFGDPKNKNNISIIREIRGKKIAFIGYNQFQNPDSQTITDEIRRLNAETDFIIVMPHWGNEYQQNFSAAQQEKGRQWIDAGADIILGNHPHVVQPIEVYHNRPILYSVGNGLFDQSFSEETQQGLSVGVVIRQEGFDVSLFPITSKNQQIQLAALQQRDTLLLRISEDSLITDDARDNLANGKIYFQY